MKMNEMSRSEEKNYKLVDLIKFICAFLVIGIHTRQFLSVSDIADRLFYYDVSNYSVPFFYACSGYFLLAKKSNIKLGDRLKIRIKKVLRLYLVWSLLYIPLTLYGWCIEGNWKLSYLFRCLRNFFCWGKLLFVDAMVSEWFDFCFACDKTDAEKILNWKNGRIWVSIIYYRSGSDNTEGTFERTSSDNCLSNWNVL